MNDFFLNASLNTSLFPERSVPDSVIIKDFCSSMNYRFLFLWALCLFLVMLKLVARKRGWEWYAHLDYGVDYLAFLLSVIMMYYFFLLGGA